MLGIAVSKSRVPSGARSRGAERRSHGGEVVSDSRLVTAGSLFVALQGTQVDGHAFAGQALSSGSRGCVE